VSQYNKELGIFTFSGEEEDVAFRFMWTCLMDLSWRGKIETIWRIIIRKPPKRYFTDWDTEHADNCPSLKGQPVCTCEHLRRFS